MSDEAPSSEPVEPSEPVERSEPSESPSLDRRRQLRLAVVSIAVLGVCAAAIIFVQLVKPVGAVTGRAVGAITKVLLSDTARGILVEGELSTDGSYSVVLPAAAREPIVQLWAADGRSFVESGVVAASDGTVIPPLALWTTEVRARSGEGKVVLDWSPIPEGEGFPERRRYSVLIRFTKADGARSEATLLSEEPRQELPLAELNQLLRDRDPANRALEIELRAFDPGQQKGPLWVGRVRDWTLPELP